MDANQLRAAFTGYFAARGHEVVPSASLIPHDPTVLFTIAGMVPFKPYFTGEQASPWPRATGVQKCFRTEDIDIVGTTLRHLTFFEMLGNFSFGDYFKEEAIPFAWEFVTDELRLDAERLWITVYESDEEAETIWRESVGVPAERIQRLGDDNFWKMGDTGPCGPSSELHYDKGDAYGPGAGPALGDSERYVEIWNLVFMQYNRLPDGSLEDLPKKNIDTGAGLDRILPILQGTESVFDADVLAPIVSAAGRLTGTRYGADPRGDVALRILADHGRAMTMLAGDGVLPSNQGRGYVLRRIIRRAVLAARRLGVESAITPGLAESTATVMGEAYPNVVAELENIQNVLTREETGFDRTLRSGLTMLEQALGEAHDNLPGEVAFRLHDTHGFPIELTEELAGEAGLSVDRPGFDRLMDEQRSRARQAARLPVAADEAAYRAILEAEGPTTFVGRSPDFYAVPTRITGVLAGTEPGTAEIFLERSPFYAEGGGQVGDTGTIVTETGRAEVYDTVPALPGLHVHRARVSGELFAGQDALAAIEAPRREAIRRNHTGTHLLHAALRNVLGDSVRQRGSLVAPDRLRFDFSHHAPVAAEELVAVAEMANGDVLLDADVETVEASREEAERMGAVAFFEEKYGDLVRVVRAGPHSLEFCGGTHVNALGMIGPITIVSEGSIGANIRRIFALTGQAAVDRSLEQDQTLRQVATLLKVEPEGVVEALDRLVDRQRATERELTRLRSSLTSADAAELAARAENGVVAARRDGQPGKELQSLAQAVIQRDGVRGVVIGGVAEPGKVAITVVTGGEPDAAATVKAVGAMVGGGGGGTSTAALAGGRQSERLDEAIAEARRLLTGS